MAVDFPGILHEAAMVVVAQTSGGLLHAQHRFRGDAGFCWIEAEHAEAGPEPVPAQAPDLVPVSTLK